MASKMVAWSILIMGISLASVIMLWAWFGYLGPTFSREVLITQQEILRHQYHLPPRAVITDPTVLLTPPSLRGIKNNTASIAAASAGGVKDVSIVQGAAALAGKAFTPDLINVKVGSTVTWTDKDTTASHTVTSGTGYTDPNKGKEFDSGISTLLTFGKTFSHTFNTAGEIPYYCQIHPTMVGKVGVS